MSKRDEIVQAAQSWIGTPFHHAARCKGAGVDCANLLVAVFSAVGLLPPITMEKYPQDWHLHRNQPRFLEALDLYATKLGNDDEPLPGDVVMFKYGRHAAHGAILIGYPTIIHAWRDAGAVVYSDIDSGPLSQRIDSFWRMENK